VYTAPVTRSASRAEAADTQDRILDAARGLFHRRGYAAVGVQEICREAGVVKGSFYHFFSTKEELLEAVIDRNWRRQNAHLERLRQAPGPARERLTGYLRGIVGHARRMHRENGQILGCDLGTIACELAPLAGAPQPRLRTVMRRWLRSLEQLIEQGREDGSLDRGVDPRATAESMLAVIQGMSVLGRTLDRPAVLDRIATAAARLLPTPEA